jgi:hypothetical protein
VSMLAGEWPSKAAEAKGWTEPAMAR